MSTADVDFAELARLLSRRVFESRFAHPFLVVAVPPTEAALEFETRVGGDLPTLKRLQDLMRAESAAPVAAAAPRVDAPRVNVLAVVKSEGNPYRDRIAIGRTRSSDLVIALPTISKLHAHLFAGQPHWEIRDAESANGTFVNGKRLVADERAALPFGATVSFGSVPGWFLDAGGLWDRIRSAPDP